METASSESIGEGVSPQPVLEAAWGFAVTRVLATGIELEVCTWIARGQMLGSRACHVVERSDCPRVSGHENQPRCPVTGLGCLPNQNKSARHRGIRAAQYSRVVVHVAFGSRILASRRSMSSFSATSATAPPCGPLAAHRNGQVPPALQRA